MDYLFVICIAILIFFIVSTMSRKEKHVSDKIFIFWLFLVVLAEITFFLSSQNLFEDFHWIYEFVCGTHVLHGAVFYFYVISLLDESFKLKRSDLLHVLPFLLYFSYKTTTKSLGLVDCLNEGGCSHSDNIYAIISVYLKLLIIGAYVFVAYLAIWKLRKRKHGVRLNSYGMKWVKSVGHGVLILLLFILAIKTLGSFGVTFVVDQVMVINIIVSVFVLSFIYVYSKFAYIFAHPFGGNNIPLNKELKLQSKEDLSEEENQYNKICSLIEEGELFKDGDLTLRKLSTIAEIPEHIISNVINRITNRSYTDFINSYRVNHFVDKIDKGENEDNTLLALAYDCGFNSKSSFNRVFKQFYELTPSEFVKTRSAC